VVCGARVGLHTKVVKETAPCKSWQIFPNILFITQMTAVASKGKQRGSKQTGVCAKISIMNEIKHTQAEQQPTVVLQEDKQGYDDRDLVVADGEMEIVFPAKGFSFILPDTVTLGQLRTLYTEYQRQHPPPAGVSDRIRYLFRIDSFGDMKDDEKRLTEYGVMDMSRIWVYSEFPPLSADVAHG
jgi:hypothetical protein